MVKNNDIIKYIVYKMARGLFLLILVLLTIPTKAEERQGLLVNGAIGIEHDDNVLRTVEKAPDSTFYIAPTAKYFTYMGKHMMYADYKGKYAAYNTNGDLSYDNHDISLFARLDHSLKIDSEYTLSYKKEVEEPGSNNSINPLIEEFNKINRKQAKAQFYYGTRKSIGQFVAELEHVQNRYINNSQNFRDVDRDKLTSTFYYRIAPKTRLLLQASIGRYDYKIQNQFADRSSEEAILLAGVEWDLTAKTSGTFRLGYQNRTFDEDEYADISGLSFILDMTWKPNTYTTIDFGASRITRESSQLQTSAFINNTYSAKALHEITQRTKLKVAYTYDTDDIATNQNRTDNRHRLKLSVDHILLKWLKVSIDFEFIKRDSDFEAFNYKSNVVGIMFTTTFE